MSTQSRLSVLLFTDLIGSTDLKARIGTPAYRPLLERHNALFESTAGLFGGTVLKHTGDGFLASFATVSDAVRAALRFQQQMRIEPWPQPMASRIGIHVGEVAIIEMAGRADVIGVAADVAARVMSTGAGGQILMTRAAFNDARQFVSEHPRLDGQPVPALRWVAHGPYLFTGVDEPIELFEVGGEGEAPLSAPTGDGKARRVVPHDQEPTLGWRPAIGLAVPQRVGWKLEKKLGEGGFGEVWLAAHEKTHQRRVFKFCFDADRLRSFKRELTLFRLLREALGERTDIARLYEVKLDEPPFFLESEWTEGGNLVDWSEARGGIGTLPLEQRLEIVAKIADAVAAAHSVGILHKDIKPSNVLVQEQRDGAIQPRLADFGIGILADRSQLAARHITETGFTVITQTSGSSMTGTRLYSPPEIMAGKPFTTQSDIYALGVVLYQMVVADLSRPLAEGWERDVADKLIRDDIAACCDGDPSRRPAGAGELSQRIRTLPQRREAEQQRLRALSAAQRRQRVVRRSIAASIAMGLLVVTVAGSSAFYIRRVRAAQRAESIQRERAEGAERAAKASEAAAQAQAVFATRLADYYNAEYLLGKSRVKEAYVKALKANIPPARWEDGHLLQRVVSQARRSWQVVGRIDGPGLVDDVPTGLGRFVSTTRDNWVLALPRGNTVEIYSVPQGNLLGRISCGNLVGAICPAGGAAGRMFVASGRTLILWDLVSMTQLATVQEEASVAQIVTRPDAPVFATFDRSGHITVRSAADLSLRARRETPPRDQRTAGGSLGGIDLSPSGKRILHYSGIWTDGIDLWDWEVDHAWTRPLRSHSAAFVDDETVGGYWSFGIGLDESTIAIQQLTPADAPAQYISMTDLKGKTSARLVIWTDNRNRQRAALIGGEGLDIRSLPGAGQIASDLYESILPLSTRSVRMIACDAPHGLLALAGDEIVLLHYRTESPWEKRTSAWSMSTCDRGMLTARSVAAEHDTIENRVTLTPFSGEPSTDFKLEWPESGTGGRDIYPWGIWSPPDGRFLAVLRQETESGMLGGTIGSKYYGKSIAIYDTAGYRDPSAPLKITHQIPMPDFEGVDGRDNRFIVVTPDAKVALYCSHALTATRYRVEDGTLLSREQLGSWAIPSQDGRFVVAGGTGTGPVKVWDIASGSVVFTTPDTGYSRRACFSSDSHYLCVAWPSDRLVWYDLTTHATVRTLKTPLLPVALPATGDRFVALRLDTSQTGSSVLASTIDGEVTVLLNPGAHIQNAAWFDPSGLRLAMVMYRDVSQLLFSLTPQEARAAVDPKGIAPGTIPSSLPTATASTSTATTSPASQATMISWKEAGDNVGRRVTVEAPIINARNIGSRCFLNVSANRHDFVVVLNPATFDHWPQPPETWFLNKTIRVTGEIILYRGGPEIILDDPTQIELVTAPATTQSN